MKNENQIRAEVRAQFVDLLKELELKFLPPTNPDQISKYVEMGILTEDVTSPYLGQVVNIQSQI